MSPVKKHHSKLNNNKSLGNLSPIKTHHHRVKSSYNFKDPASIMQSHINTPSHHKLPSLGNLTNQNSTKSYGHLLHNSSHNYNMNKIEEQLTNQLENFGKMIRENDINKKIYKEKFETYSS